MKFLSWKPFTELETVLNELPVFAKTWDLVSDMYEEDGKFVVEMHAAGIKPENIDIEVNENMLRISGKREEEQENKGKYFFRKEIHRGEFERTFVLPVYVQPETSEATFENGILKVVLHKEKAQNPHKVKVNVH